MNTALRIAIFLFIVLIVPWLGFQLFLQPAQATVDVSPRLVGHTDSIRITFGTIDTTYYPAVANADSLVILVYPPDNGTPDSVGEDAATCFNLTTGYYQYHRLGANGDTDLGVYTVAVIAYKGGAKRGIGTASYTVTKSGTYYYNTLDSARDFAADYATVANDVYDTLYVHKQDFHSSGDTNSNPFQAGTDDVFLAGNYATIGNDVYDTLYVHKEDFHSSGDTNSNPFQAGTDDVFLSGNYAQLANDVYDTMYVHRDDFKGGTADSVWLYDAERWEVANDVYDTLYVHRDDFKGGTADSVWLYDQERWQVCHDVYDTLLQHNTDFQSSGDTNQNPFQAGTDNVFLANNYAQIANDNYDTLFVHKEDFHSSGDTNSNPFQAGTDDVLLAANYAQIANDNYDTLYVHKEDFHSSGDTNSNPFQAGTDNVLLASNYAQIANDNYDTMYVHRDDFKGGTADSVYLYDQERAEIANDVYDTLYVHKEDFQGSAAGLTAAEVADTLEGRGLFSGAGAFACTVYTKLGADSSALAGIHVIAKNTDQTLTLGHCYTNANGWCPLGLDSIAGGAYHKFWLMDVDYSFSFPESADVNTDTGLTFYGSAFDYGDPPPENQCAIYGQLFDPQLDSLEGAIIKAWVHVPYSDSILRYQGHVISRFQVADTTTASGRWRLDLIPNSLFLPASTYYVFSFEYPVSWGGYIARRDTATVPADTARSWKELKGW